VLPPIGLETRSVTMDAIAEATPCIYDGAGVMKGLVRRLLSAPYGQLNRPACAVGTACSTSVGIGLRTAQLVMLALMVAVPAGAQAPPRLPMNLDSLLKAHAHPLRNPDGSRNDTGWSFLLREIGDAQVVAVAEEHNVAEIPQFTTTLFERLHATLGFDYFADEQDPYFLRSASARQVRGNADSLWSFVRRNPGAPTFATDEELAMLADIARVSTARGNPLWGLDQTYGALHLLDRLHELARGSDARTAIEKLRARARPFELNRFAADTQFMSQIASEADFTQLDSLLRPRAGSEAAWLIGALRRSAHIYGAYRLATQGNATSWENAWSREQYLKERFTEEYRLAQARGDSLPRVLVKAGHWHVHRGVYPSSQALTLGNFVSEVAQFHGRQSYVITTGITGPPGQWRAYAGPLAASAPPDAWTLIDLRAVRAYARGTRVGSMTDALRTLIFTADAALYFGAATPGKFSLRDSVARQQRR